MRRRDTLDITFNKDAMSVHDLKKVAETFETVLDYYQRYVDDFDDDPNSAIDFFYTFGDLTSRTRTHSMVAKDAKEDV
jgi:hypothetical protein